MDEGNALAEEEPEARAGTEGTRPSECDFGAEL